MLAPTAGIYTNVLLTAVQQEAISALLCAATLYGSKISNKGPLFEFADFFGGVHPFAFHTAIFHHICACPFVFPHIHSCSSSTESKAVLWATEVITVGHLLGVCYGGR